MAGVGGERVERSLRLLPLAEKACPPGKEATVVDENLIFYQNWELEACVNGIMLASQMDLVNEFPFTYEQLNIFKHKLDEVSLNGLPCACCTQDNGSRSYSGLHGPFFHRPTHKAILSL